MLFRFYMGYVFPSLNCIDEGVERWLRADRMAQYTEAPVVDVRYFTFLPDFVPQALVRCARAHRTIARAFDAEGLFGALHGRARKTTPAVMTTADRTPDRLARRRRRRSARRRSARDRDLADARLHSHRQVAGQRTDSPRAAGAGVATARVVGCGASCCGVSLGARAQRVSRRGLRSAADSVDVARSVSAMDSRSISAAARACRSAAMGDCRCGAFFHSAERRPVCGRSCRASWASVAGLSSSSASRSTWASACTPRMKLVSAAMNLTI